MRIVLGLAFLLPACAMQPPLGDPAWWEQVRQADAAQIERRIKLLEVGELQLADLTRPQSLTLPEGRKGLFLFGTGTHAFRVREGELDHLLREGSAALTPIPVTFAFADGTVLNSAPWDFIIAEWAEPGGPRLVGYAGMMEQPRRLAGASPDAPAQPAPGFIDNASRSRHALDIRLGADRILATDLGSLFGDRPSVAREWISEQHAHGYSGRLLQAADGTLFRDPAGRAWVVYERVVEEELRYADGTRAFQRKDRAITTWHDERGNALGGPPAAIPLRRLPRETAIFARPLRDATTAFPAADEVKLLGVRPQEGARPYRATERENGGTLVEGANPFYLDLGDGFHGLAFSAGDFTAGEGYGALFAFRRAADGPIGPYEPLIGADGDLVNFTRALGREHGILWGPGRPDCFRDGRGEWWMLVHGIPRYTLPEALRRGGWPESDEAFRHFRRRGFLVPIRWSLRGGKPWLEIEDARGAIAGH